MRRVLVLTAAAVVLATNAWTLIAAWRNRSGPSGGTMELTERELRLVQVPWESTATSLELRWSVAPGKSAVEGTLIAGSWLDATKLEELGFDCSVPVDSPNAKEHYTSMPRMLVFVVLKYVVEGEGWWQAGRGDPEPETRLFVVDAGRDARRLRDKFADTKRYVITRGVVRLSYQEHSIPDGIPLPKPRLQGEIVSVLPSDIFVPRPHSRVLEEFRHRGPPTPEPPEPPEGEPRFAVTVSWGSNYEPWVHGVRRLTAESLERKAQHSKAPEGDSSAADASDNGAGVSAASASASSKIETRYLEYSQKLLGKYDRNGDGQLERDEWIYMGKNPEAADVDGDGRITVEEYVGWASRGGPWEDHSSSSSKRKGSDDNAAEGDGVDAFRSLQQEGLKRDNDGARGRFIREETMQAKKPPRPHD